jgi:hypothetical protein
MRALGQLVLVLLIVLVIQAVSLLALAPVAAICVGDCSGDGQVTVDELIVGINIGLGEAPVEACAAIDLGGDGEVTVDEIVGADPDIAGVQGIALAGRPSFDMPVDCAAGVLYVAEPKLLMQGGGRRGTEMRRFSDRQSTDG